MMPVPSRAARRAAVALATALTTGIGCSAHAAIAGSAGERAAGIAVREQARQRLESTRVPRREVVECRCP